MQITREETTGTAALWFGVLAGPIGWSVQLAVDYMLEEWISCTRGFRMPGFIWSLSTRAWIVGINGVLLLVVLAALAVSLTNLRRFRAADLTPERRAMWMAGAGVINSIVFAIPIALGFLPAAILRSCQFSP